MNSVGRLHPKGRRGKTLEAPPTRRDYAGFGRALTRGRRVANGAFSPAGKVPPPAPMGAAPIACLARERPYAICPTPQCHRSRCPLMAPRPSTAPVRSPSPPPPINYDSEAISVETLKDILAQGYLNPNQAQGIEYPYAEHSLAELFSQVNQKSCRWRGKSSRVCQRSEEVRDGRPCCCGYRE